MKTSSEKLVDELRRTREPMTRELMLADIAKIYGNGFADTLRRQLESEIEARRK